MKDFKGIFLTISLSLLLGSIFAGDLHYPSNLLVFVYFKAQTLRDTAVENIRKLEKEINENKNSIAKAERIISIARGREDAKAKQAEQIATEALQKARSALLKNEQTLNEWKLKKQKAEISLVTIRNLLSENGSSQKIKGFVSDYSGRVDILKANGKTVSLNKDTPGFIEPGDEVWTLNGTAEVQMLDGRGVAKIGPYSKFIMKKDTPQEQVVELVKGKLYMAIDKLDDFVKKMNEKIERIKNKKENEGELKSTIKNAANVVKSIAQSMEASIYCNNNDLLSKCVQEYLKKHNYNEAIQFINTKYNLNTPTAVIGVRGTKFALEVKDNNTSEISVIEGSVEVSSLNGNSKVVVNEGYKVTATKKGIRKPVKIPKTKLKILLDKFSSLIYSY